MPPPIVVRRIIRYLNQLAAVPCGLQHRSVPTISQVHVCISAFKLTSPAGPRRANCRKTGNQSIPYDWDAFSGFGAPRAQR